MQCSQTMALVRQSTKLLQSAQLLPSSFVLSRDGPAARGVLSSRGLFGRETGKSISKVLSSPSDGLAQIEGKGLGRETEFTVCMCGRCMLQL